jgi:hypothetical protein
MSKFDSNGQRLLALIAAIPGLSADQVDQVTAAWRRASPDGRSRAWAQLSRKTSGDQRSSVLVAAALARREALETARRTDRADWAFWAAASDAGAAVAAGEQIGRHYDTLVTPFAAVVPLLAEDPGSCTAAA